MRSILRLPNLEETAAERQIIGYTGVEDEEG
jgi:hypothetical protein